MGADPYPAEEPQAAEDRNVRDFFNLPAMHDEVTEPGSGEYQFFYGNGQLHVSPFHDHDELRSHAGVPSDHTGPVSLGFVTVDRGRATWHTSGNVSVRGVYRILKDYTKQVGWQWGGLTDLDGEPINDDFGPKKSMQMIDNETGERHTFIVQGKTANPAPWMTLEHLREIAKSFRIAEYPGGGNMNDQMTNYWPGGEHLDQYNLGDNSGDFPEVEADEKPTGTFRCPECAKVFNRWGEYLLHRKSEESHEAPVEDGKFPPLPNMDLTLPQKFFDRRPYVMPLASIKDAERYDEFTDWADFLGLREAGTRYYGAFLQGSSRGLAAVRTDHDDPTKASITYLGGNDNGTRTALLVALQTHYASVEGPEEYSTDAQRVGFVRTASGVRWAAGQQPKDMIDRPIPFIYDVQEDKLTVGHPGQRTTDVMIPGKFTPGGIVEGEYEPGGKVHIHSLTTMPYSARHLWDLWYWSYPHMEITGIELHDNAGNVTKIASHKMSTVEVGQYIKTLAMTDPAAWNAYQALRKAGGHTYVVGGAVRDALMQKEPKDIDLMVTGVPPEKVQQVLDALPGRVDLTGKNFGVYRYNTKGHEVEIALPRTETSTGDRRVNFDVRVDHQLPVEDDLLRRDFTINSMAVSLDDGRLVDPYGGAEDIEARRLHTTHPSSFQEDPTRLARALVMAGRYGLQPDERTRQEIKENAHRLSLESPDAVQPILDKLFSSNDPARAIRLAHDTGLLGHIFPEVEQHWNYDQNNPHHNYPLGEHLLNVLENTSRQSSDPDLRVAALLHDIGKPASRWDDPETGISHYYRGPNGEGDDHHTVGANMAEPRLRALRWPVARINRIQHLIEHHMFPSFSSAKGARKFLHRVGDEHADDLLTLRYADQHGKGQTPAELAARTSVDQMRGLVEQSRFVQAPTSQSALAINGNDILALGVKPGPEIGRILRQLTDDVVEDPHLNDPTVLKQRAQEYVNALA
jgi:tRNA nucleotidyltransferase (CCA-adding enzyme)